MAYDIRYAFLSDLIYRTSKDQVSDAIHFIDPEGGAWVLKYIKDDGTLNGYQGGVFVNVDTNEVVLVNRGTEPALHDIGNDLSMGIGSLPAQYSSAKEAYNAAIQVASDLGLNPSNTVITGHSLGGSLSQLLGAEFGNKTETFNAYGAGNLVSQLGITPAGDFSNINNYVLHYDPVSVLPGSSMLGQTFDYLRSQDSFLDSPLGQFIGRFLRPGFFEQQIFDSHSIINFLNPAVASEPGKRVSISIPNLFISLTDALKEKFGKPFLEFPVLSLLVSKLFTASTVALPNKDPLALDLNGDGLTTVGINTTTPLMFDLDANGVKESVGWLGADDGFLALDKNGNGLIDSGAELFGDATTLTRGPRAGQKALDGFEALADLDTNGDGLINTADTPFANLRVWQDANHDGLTQAGELKTLASLGVVSLNVGATSHSQTLTNGNRIADLGTYTKSDGTQQGLGENTQLSTEQSADIDLAVDTFHSQFIDTVPLTAEAQTLPDMQGAGQVRGLREAASLDTPAGHALATLLSQYAAATTRDAQQALLDPLLAAWAATSTMSTTFNGAYAGHALTVNMQRIAPGSAAYQAWVDKLTHRIGKGQGMALTRVRSGANDGVWRLVAQAKCL